MLKKYIVFDIGGTFIKWAIVDEKFKIIKNDKFRFDAANRNCKIELIAEIGQKIKEAQKEYFDLAGIGISTAGDVHPDTTEILGSAPHHNNYIGTNYRQELSKYSNLPIIIDNDANVAILGESIKGQLKDTSNAVMITLGTDIGCGILINNQIYRGFGGSAGEAGYLNVLGRRWGTYFSALGLSRLAKEYNNIDNIEPIDVLKNTNNNFGVVVDLWYEGLSIGIANLIAILNPQKLIIGGGLSESNSIDLNLIKTIVNKNLIENHLINSCQIEISKHGNNSAIYGCVQLLNESIN